MQISNKPATTILQNYVSMADSDKKPNRSISLNIPELSITPCELSLMSNNNGADHFTIDNDNNYASLAQFAGAGRQTDL